MANVRKRGGTYKIEVYKGRDINGKKIVESTTFTPDPKKTDRQNQKALDKFVYEFEEKVKNGVSRGDALTFQQYADEWLVNYADVELKPTTADSYRRLLEGLAYPVIGYMKLSAIRPSTITKLRNTLAEKGYTTKTGEHKDYSPRTIQDVETAVSSVLSSALEDELIMKNPCSVRRRGKSKKKVEEKTVDCWTPEQAAFFLDRISRPIDIVVPEKTQIRNGKPVKINSYISGSFTVQQKYVAYYWLAIYSGARRGELISLKWENVDFENSTITIRESAHYTKKTGQYDATPKTQSAYRSIILPDEVMHQLKLHKREQAEDIMLLGTAWKGDRTQTTGHVFTQPEGEEMAIGTPRAELHRIITALNKTLSEGEQLPYIKLHALRDTSASILIASGLDPVSVAKRLGHSDATTTLRHYAHAFEERDRAASDALATALNNAKKKAI